MAPEKKKSLPGKAKILCKKSPVLKMDLLQTVILSVVLAFLTFVAVYALFSLFTVLGFLWSFILLFVVFLFLIGSMPRAGNAGQIVVARRYL